MGIIISNSKTNSSIDIDQTFKVPRALFMPVSHKSDARHRLSGRCQKAWFSILWQMQPLQKEMRIFTHCSVAVRIPVPDRDNGWDWQIFLPVIHPPFPRNPSFLYPGNTEPGLGFKQGSLERRPGHTDPRLRFGFRKKSDCGSVSAPSGEPSFRPDDLHNHPFSI